MVAFGSEKSTNVRDALAAEMESATCALHGLLDALRPRTAAERAALDFLTPERHVAPPMLPEPAGAMLLAVPGWPVHLNARIWGAEKGAGAPLALLLHGWEGQLYDMVPLVQPLLDRGFRVVAFDAPAHGRSAGEQSSITDFARAARLVARTVGPIAVAVGHSMGASALALAVEDGMEVDRMVLLAPPAEPLRYAKLAAKLHRLDADETVRMLHVIDRALGRAVASISLAATASRMTVPALFVHSTDDRVVPVDDSLRAAGLWRGSRIHLVEGLGHRRILSDRAVLDEVTGWIAGHPA